MTATITARAFTGTNAATMSAAQSTFTLVAADALTGGNVLPGTVSYERWIALRVDAVPDTGATNFYVIASGNSLPSGVTIKFGVTDTAATPKNTVSTVATMDLTNGRKYIFDTGVLDGIGDLTRYLVLQEVVAVGAPSGAIGPQTLKFGWAEA